MSDTPITISGGDELGNSGPGWVLTAEEEVRTACADFGDEIDWWQPDEYTVTPNNGGMNATGF